MITTPLSPGGGGGGVARVVHSKAGSSTRSSGTLFWRSAGPSAVIRTCNVSSYSTRTPLRAYAVASQTLSPGLDMTDVGSAPTMPSPDLRDMATLQLGMLYQLLSMAGTNYSAMRCTVYARTFMDVGPGQVKLVRVAKFPVTPGQGDDLHTAQQSTLLLHTEQSWALQGGSAAVDPSGLIEDCLLHREVVALPHSSALVFPLVDSGVLVGLLVVELDASGAAAGAAAAAGGAAGQQAGVRSAQPAVDAAFASIPALAAGGAAAMLPKLCLAQEAAAAQGAGTAGSRSGAAGAGVQECSVEGLLDDGVDGEHARAGHHRNLTDEELRCLRLAVPLLAKACGMDARASWQVAQSSLTAAAARGLLREAQRPLSTLNTFGSMLVPRLKDGEPDKDMAKGILLQGRRLQDLVWQLEEALHGPTPQAAAAAAAAVGMPVVGAGPALTSGAAAGGVALGPGAGVAAGLGAGLGAGPASPFRSPVALPLDQSPAVQELLQLPPPRPVALPPRAAPDEPAVPEVDSAAPQGLVSPPPVHPGRVTYAEPATPSSTLEPSSSAPGSAPFTIRQPAAARAAVRPGTPPAGPGAAMATIDVETDCSPSDGASSSASCAGGADSSHQPGSPRVPSALAIERSSGGGGAVGASGPFSWAPGSAVSTNVVAALAGVLTAACRLAAVSGIGFIVNSPLSAVLPRRSTGKPRPASGAGAAAGAAALGAAGDRAPRVARPSSTAAAGAGAAAVDLDSVVEGPRLIPRPARPLLVGVRAALVAKIVGYMLDICLQSTPRGGQLCVSARQDGAGVQLVLLHTGRMDLQRLHMRSRSLMAATSAPVAAASAAAAAVPTLATASAAVRGTNGSHTAAAGTGRGSGGSQHQHQHQQPSVTTTAGAGGAQAGSGVLSVELAQELAQQAGGHLTVSYPCNMVNAGSGSLDLGTSVEIWLPGPGALN